MTPSTKVKVFVAHMDIGREHLNADALTLADVLHHLGGVLIDRSEKRREVLARLVAFEVARLVGHQRIGRRMALVESVAGKADISSNMAVAMCSGTPLRTAPATSMHRPPHDAVDKVVAFLLHHVVLLLAHGAAHEIRPAIGKAA